MSTVIQSRSYRSELDVETSSGTSGRYWLAGTIALVGLVAGIAFGLDSYRDSQRHIDSFDRVRVPGTSTLQIAEATGLVVYYEGRTGVTLDDLRITIIDPTGAAIDVDRYEGELVYETLDAVEGRAVATFDPTRPGPYVIEVRGTETGTLRVGDSYAQRALPGVLTGLGIAGLSLAVAFVIWLLTYVARHGRTQNAAPR